MSTSNSHLTIKELRAKAEQAKDKKAGLGPDINLLDYSDQVEDLPLIDLTSLSTDEQKRLLLAGVDPQERNRSGTFVQMDHSIVCRQVYQEGLEVLDTEEALKKYDWVREKYWWKAVPVDADKYTSQAERKWTKGYFLRALPGVKSIYPIQACLYLSQDGIAQNVHNIIIVEEGSELHIITGCAVGSHVKSALHVGISEFYVKKGAKLTFTMIHNWEEKIEVRPRSAAIVEEGGLFLSNYICVQPVKSLQMYPKVTLEGKNAVTRLNSILLATPNSLLDVGGRAVLKAPNSRAEVMSRAIAKGGKIWARGHLIGEAPQIKAHLECQGLILGETGIIHAIPELDGRHPDVDLSHEASVGKIDQEEIEYLMARGLSEEEAIASIVRGFLDVKIEGLPPELQVHLDKALVAGEKYML